MKKLLVALGWFAYSVATVVLSTYTALCLWGWFVVESFGVINISFNQMLGLKLTINYFFKSFKSDEEDDDENTKRVRAVMIPLIVLGTGWIVHRYV